MNDVCENIQPLLSGYLDAELPHDDRARVEAHLAQCAQCTKELEDLNGLVAAADQMRFAEPPDEVWDAFTENVYNRLGKRTGFLLLAIASTLLLGLALFFIVVAPWAPPLVKFAVEIGLLGLVVLFVIVLRERLHMLKTDRYTRDVKR